MGTEHGHPEQLWTLCSMASAIRVVAPAHPALSGVAQQLVVLEALKLLFVEKH
jgi:hypothetical protein